LSKQTVVALEKSPIFNVFEVKNEKVELDGG
jgi:hypothetical protein